MNFSTRTFIQLDLTHQLYYNNLCHLLNKRHFYAALYGNAKALSWFTDVQKMYLMGGEL